VHKRAKLPRLWVRLQGELTFSMASFICSSALGSILGGSGTTHSSTSSVTLSINSTISVIRG